MSTVTKNSKKAPVNAGVFRVSRAIYQPSHTKASSKNTDGAKSGVRARYRRIFPSAQRRKPSASSAYPRFAAIGRLSPPVSHPTRPLAGFDASGDHAPPERPTSPLLALLTHLVKLSQARSVSACPFCSRSPTYGPPTAGAVGLGRHRHVAPVRKTTRHTRAFVGVRAARTQSSSRFSRYSVVICASQCLKLCMTHYGGKIGDNSNNFSPPGRHLTFRKVSNEQKRHGKSRLSAAPLISAEHCAHCPTSALILRIDSRFPVTLHNQRRRPGRPLGLRVRPNCPACSVAPCGRSAHRHVGVP